MFLGYEQGGAPALLVAGALFIVPAMLVMLGIGWIYVHFGATPEVRHVLFGIRPVVVAVVAWALWDLGRRILLRRAFVPLAGAALLLALMNVHPVLLLLGAGLIGAAGVRFQGPASSLVLLGSYTGFGHDWHGTGRLLTVFLTFLKIGAFAYGSGYVLLAFLHVDFVSQLHWLTERQLLDAIAISQATPGPVFTTATFLGYGFAGVPGALLATLAIFLPGFVLVPWLNRLVRVVESRLWAQAFLNGANVATIGLIAAATLQVARVSIVDLPTAVFFLVSLLVLLWRPLWPAPLVLLGAVVGLALGRG